MSWSDLIPELQQFGSQLYAIAEGAGVHPRITSTLRTYAQQKALYERWQQGLSKFPAAPPGHSAHEYGYAFDMVVNGATNQADCGIVWKQWGLKYGGEEDPVHFEYPGFTPGYTPVDPALIDPGASLYTPGKAEIKARQLVDVLVQYVSGLDTVSKAASTTAILTILGLEPAGPPSQLQVGFDSLLWGLAHPEEFLGTWWDAFRSTLLSYL